MSWLDELQPASFRGVAFLVESMEAGVGRRNVTHEYPKRDVPYTEDMGRAADELTFSAFLLGEDTGTARRALLDAIRNRNTPGTLIHPLYGSIQVIPKGCRHRIDYGKGRIEYFDLTFAESGANQYPNALDDTASLVSQGGETLIAAVGGLFKATFSVANLPQFVTDHAQGISTDIATAITQAAGLKTRDPQAAAEVLDQVSTFQAGSGSLLATPADFADQVADLTLQVQSVYPAPRDGFQAYVSLANFGATYPTIAETTTTRRQQAQNQRLLVGLTRRAVLIGLAKTAAEIAFESYDEAVATRNQLHEQFDRELLSIGATDEDAVYVALDGLRASMVKDITDRAANLERTKRIRPQAVQPALVASYQLYATAARADEIVQRNRIRHPGFLPANQDLQVLVG